MTSNECVMIPSLLPATRLVANQEIISTPRRSYSREGALFCFGFLGSFCRFTSSFASSDETH